MSYYIKRIKKMLRFLSYFERLVFYLPKDMNKIIFFSKRVFHFSGAKYIYRKFIPVDNGQLPTGFLWLIGLYFAAYTFTAQRYEAELGKIEFKYNLFITQIASGVSFSNDRLMEILNDKIPLKPIYYKPITIIQSFVFDAYSESFYNTSLPSKINSNPVF